MSSRVNRLTSNGSSSSIDCSVSPNSSLASPPWGYQSYTEFSKDYSLGNASTEGSNPITTNLSQLMRFSVPRGMELLLKVDEIVIQGLTKFIPTIETLAPRLAENLRGGGRVFLLGAGSSGRIAIDLAAKCAQAFPAFTTLIRGIIAGGDTALIRAKEDYEDSEAAGVEVVKSLDLKRNDVIFLLSASGSSTFNVGCGHEAANSEAKVYYFYNNRFIPDRSQQLFQRPQNAVMPLCVDIGPQAITGSTRLQAATLAEACLGSLLGSSLLYCSRNEDQAEKYPGSIVSKLQENISLLRTNLKKIASFSETEAKLFSSPNSNFRRLKDESNQGYVTFLVKKNSSLETLIDSVECPPTFSVSSIRKDQEAHKKRPEFQMYLLENGDNRTAWKSILGREVDPKDIDESDSFPLSIHSEGIDSYQKRPTGKDNFVVGVVKLKEGEDMPSDLINALASAKLNGATIGIIALKRDSFSDFDTATIEKLSDVSFYAGNVSSDILGISETILLKQALNLISNSSMSLMNKIYGNRLIDGNASNQKLIDRCMRLTNDIWKEFNDEIDLDETELYHLITHIVAKKKVEENQGAYTPSVTKIALTMLLNKMGPDDFTEAVKILSCNNECINSIAPTNLKKGNKDDFYVDV